MEFENEIKRIVEKQIEEYKKEIEQLKSENIELNRLVEKHLRACKICKQKTNYLFGNCCHMCDEINKCSPYNSEQEANLIKIKQYKFDNILSYLVDTDKKGEITNWKNILQEKQLQKKIFELFYDYGENIIKNKDYFVGGEFNLELYIEKEFI